MSLDTLKPKVAKLIKKAQSGGNTAELEAIIDNSGVLDSTEGTVEEKVEQLVDKAEYENLWYIASQSLENLTNTFRYVDRFPRIKPIKCKYCTSMCNGNKKIESIDFILDFSTTGTQFDYAFRDTSNLKFIKGITARWIRAAGMFSNSGIEVIEEAFDYTGVSSFANLGGMFNNANALREVRFVEKTIGGSFSFTSAVLSAESKQSIFDGLATVETAQTLTLNANLKILQSQVDSANAKGWTVAGGTVVSEEEYYG